MNKTRPIMRRCISCRVLQERSTLFKITNDHNLGILFKSGMGRSAYICKSEKCSRDSKLKKNLQKALKTNIDSKIYEIISMEIQNYK